MYSYKKIIIKIIIFIIVFYIVSLYTYFNNRIKYVYKTNQFKTSKIKEI